MVEHEARHQSYTLKAYQGYGHWQAIQLYRLSTGTAPRTEELASSSCSLRASASPASAAVDAWLGLPSLSLAPPMLPFWVTGPGWAGAEPLGLPVLPSL